MRRRIAVAATGFCALLGAQAAGAGTLDLGNEVELEYKLTVTYALAMRTKHADPRLTDAPVEEFSSYLNIPAAAPAPGQPAQIFRFEGQGLSQSINSDDGDRNFDKWALIHNRLSGLGELQLHWQDYGAVLSGSGFIDDVYHRSNDNDSPRTLNQFGPAGEYPDPKPREFSGPTKRYDGGRARVLEAYLYGSWWLSDESSLNLRAGQQLVAWGESLFFSGIASAMGPADATKAFVPGAEVKDILLPVNQIALNLAVNNELSLVGYYKLSFRPTEIFPVGDYLSPADVVGPGAQFVYGSANPLAATGSCSGLLQNFHLNGAPVSVVSPQLETLVCGLLGITADTLIDAPDYIYTYREKDLKPSAFGQYGGGVKYQLTSSTNLGLYYLRYNDTNPAVQLNVGFASFGTVGGVNLSTQALNQYVPVSYNVKYFDGIHLAGLSYSTVLGGFNIAGELNYRDGIDTPVEAQISGHLSPMYQRGRISQALVSALYVTNPRLFFDDLVSVNEAGFLHVNGVDRLSPSPGIIPVGEGGSLFYDRNAYGFMSLLIPTKHNIISGWDFQMPIVYGWLIKGTPAMAGAFGPLYGDGDMRASLSFNMQYLQNLQLGVGYNWFFGSPNKTIKHSTLAANPYSDRDYLTFNLKYNF
ncbi:DUF1302 domain-containing protein [Solimonas aquatica]|nr:DUF1302 family protein [Solimonas aquatica]